MFHPSRRVGAMRRGRSAEAEAPDAERRSPQGGTLKVGSHGRQRAGEPEFAGMRMLVGSSILGAADEDVGGRTLSPGVSAIAERPRHPADFTKRPRQVIEVRDSFTGEIVATAIHSVDFSVSTAPAFIPVPNTVYTSAARNYYLTGSDCDALSFLMSRQLYHCDFLRLRCPRSRHQCCHSTC